MLKDNRLKRSYYPQQPSVVPPDDYKTSPDSALPLSQPWLQQWQQHWGLFSQNAPVCRSFCPWLVRYSHQFPWYNRGKKMHMDTFFIIIQLICEKKQTRTKHSIGYVSCFWVCNPDFIVCLPLWAHCLSPDSDSEEIGKRKKKMGDPWHFLRPVPACTSLTV